MTTTKRATIAVALVSATIALAGCGHSEPRFYPYGAGSIYEAAPHDPYGWFGDRYYPGTGNRVYDRRGNAYVWSKAERLYWSGRDDHRHGRHEQHERRARTVD